MIDITRHVATNKTARQQMKRIFQLIGLAVTLSPAVVKASQPTLTSISQPLYFLGSSSDAKIEIIETPKILNNSSAMAWIELFFKPYGGSWFWR
jgi:hypothetical protein